MVGSQQRDLWGQYRGKVKVTRNQLQDPSLVPRPRGRRETWPGYEATQDPCLEPPVLYCWATRHSQLSGRALATQPLLDSQCFFTFFYCCLITSNNFNQIIVLISEGNIIVEHSFHSFLNSFNAYSTPADSLKAAGIQRDPTSNTQPPVAAVESSSTRYSEPVVIKMSPPLAVRQEEPKFDPYADDIDPYAISPRMQVYMERQMRQKCCR